MGRLLTGIRPTGELHLGNFLGAFQVLKGWEGKCFVFIGDLHGATTHFCSRKQVLSKAREVLAIMATLEVKSGYVFLQSQNSNHLELAWFLGSLTPVGQLNTMWAYKEKSKKGGNFSLLGYPILMAADIMLYTPCLVPVGKDQTQHLEFYSKLADKVNRLSPMNLKVETLEEEVKVMDLKNPEVKMSKSNRGKLGIINLTDSLEEVRKKIWGAKTSTEDVKTDTSPGTMNLLRIASYLGAGSVDEVRSSISNHEGLKEKVYTYVSELISSFQRHHGKLLKLPDEKVLSILHEGLAEARQISQGFMEHFLKAIVNLEEDK